MFENSGVGDLIIVRKLKKYINKISLAGYFTAREFVRDQCPTRAAALTYFTMLSLVPLLVLIFVFFKTFGGESLIENQIKPLLFSLLSTGSGESISGAIDELINQSRAGALGSIGFLFLILTSFFLMDQIHFTLNAIWGERKSRPILQRWIIYWAALTILPFLVIMSISLTAYLGSLKEVQELSEQVVPRIYNLIPFLLQGFAFLVLYIYLPKVKVRFVPALAGAAVASIIWEFMKKGYLLYTSNAISYNVIYGSLAVLPLFMIWLYLSWATILFGAEFSFAIQNFRMIRDSRKRMNIPRQWFEALGLELVIESTRCFLNGKGQVESSVFAEERSIPRDLAGGAADKLCSGGLLKDVDGALVLNRDPATLTVQDVVDAIRSGNAETPPFSRNGNLTVAHDFLFGLESQDREAKSEWTIKKVLDDFKEQGKID